MIAIDLGSNTLRITKIDCKSKKFVSDFEKIVKTADGLAVSNKINSNAVNRIICAVKEAKNKIDFKDEKIKAVTTEALRRASNAQDVLSQIKKETNISFNVIDGEEEARLTLLAVKHRLVQLKYASKSFVLVDIGGGSTEVIFSYYNKVISKSFPVGIVTIAQAHKNLENIEKVLPKEMASMQKFCNEIYANNGKVNFFVATAGTPTTVAAMKLGQTYSSYNAKKINGTSITKEELDFYLKKLLSMTFEKRELTVGVGRSDLIAAGILIYKQLFGIVNFTSCIVIDDGLREGLALDGCRE